MKQLTAFINKEFTEVCRNSKLMICGILFLLFGIMNPATAKITPWLMKNMSATSKCRETVALLSHSLTVKNQA